MNEDTELLRRFAEEGSQAAFAELVRGKVGLVFAAALRQTGGDAHLAQDVTQMVFVTLAREAGRLRRHTVLAGWLHTTTRYLAIRAVRRQQRWQRREKEANAMSGENQGTAAEWASLRPVIDEALHELAAKEREAILLRFFEGRTFGEVGAAVGVAENAARMRVERALEKLRGRLARRGITSTAAVLGAALASQPAVAVPTGLAASAVAAGCAAAAVGAGATVTALGLTNLMTTTKVTLSACGVMAVLGVGAWWSLTYQNRGDATPGGTAARAVEQADGGAEALRAENRRLLAEIERARAEARRTTASGAMGLATTDGGGNYSALRTLIDVRRRKLANLEFEFFGDGAQMEPAFAELFGLSESERAGLQQAIDAAQGKLNALVRENTSVSRTANGGVAIAVRPFPEAGGAIYDAVLKTFSDTLGTERYQAFLALGAEQVEKKLGRFGTAQRTILLSRETNGGEVNYRINDHSRWSERDNSNYVSDRLAPERLARELGPLVDVLPGDFLPRR